ncbi:hypothetical protein JTE90_025205 [Oedothorax gibbosus]|uniref:Uncharacterized protein n=1 Tax=Oedothorax gibbosus TaxID=931172 RepID=A0AAV6UTM1_9ARAC|nr:hypothetical protein JTE90_025205 [Oedothorax gibbosus]
MPNSLLNPFLKCAQSGSTNNLQKEQLLFSSNQKAPFSSTSVKISKKGRPKEIQEMTPQTRRPEPGLSIKRSPSVEE